MQEPSDAPAASHILFFILTEDMLIDFREQAREAEREGEKRQCERETSTGCLIHPDRGAKPATQACALTGNQTDDLSMYRMTPTEPHHPGLLLMF